VRLARLEITRLTNPTVCHPGEGREPPFTRQVDCGSETGFATCTSVDPGLRRDDN
jgi:hypothetical protein